MFMSNTAACLAIMPNALSILRKIEEEVGASKQTMNVGKALIFGVALMASVGGTATIIGTPPNAILVGVCNGHHHVDRVDSQDSIPRHSRLVICRLDKGVVTCRHSDWPYHIRIPIIGSVS